MSCIKRITTCWTWHRLCRAMCKQQFHTRGNRSIIACKELQAISKCLNSLPAGTHSFRAQDNLIRQCSTEVCQGLSESQYEELADETLDSLTEKFEDLPERLTSCDPEYDVTFGSGVLTVKISQSWGTYVINKQVPNKQIWLSSPLSGPKRYDYTDGIWIYKHDGQTLHDLLTKEISQALGDQIDFTDCVFGKR